MDGENFHENYQRNVLGGRLQSCSTSPVTGFFRDGCCHTGPQDVGSHTVCAVMTDAFLAFSLAAGNDLSTPRPEFDFPGLKAGDRWCLCAQDGKRRGVPGLPHKWCWKPQTKRLWPLFSLTI